MFVLVMQFRGENMSGQMQTTTIQTRVFDLDHLQDYLPTLKAHPSPILDRTNFKQHGAGEFRDPRVPVICNVVRRSDSKESDAVQFIGAGPRREVFYTPDETVAGT